MKIKIKIRLYLAVILGAVVVFLFWMAIVPLGKITYSLNPGETSDFVSKLNPDTRVNYLKNYFKIIGDPVYFNLRAPRNFEKAKLIVKYKRKNLDLPVIEAGILVDNLIWRYKLKPLENVILDNFLQYDKSPFLGWENMRVIEEDAMLLIQKEEKYSSISEFISSPPPNDQIAVYNYDLQNEFLLPEYQADSEGLEIKSRLQGGYQFYTYIKDEVLNFNFQYIDLNKNKSEDQVDLILYYEDNLIYSAQIEDDGITTDNRQESSLQSASIVVPDLPEGVYKIELKANDDIVTENIKTNQRKLSFINRLNLFGEDTNLKILTNADELKLKTTNPAFLQNIKFGNNELEIEKAYSQFVMQKNGTSSLDWIEMEKGGLILEGRGVFCFDENHFIDPSIVQLNQVANLDQNIKYILADYKSPKKNNDWMEATAEFDLGGAYRENQKYSFLISVPGLRADDNIDDWIEIGEIRIELEGKNIFEKFKSILKK